MMVPEREKSVKKHNTKTTQWKGSANAEATLGTTDKTIPCNEVNVHMAVAPKIKIDETIAAGIPFPTNEGDLAES